MKRIFCAVLVAIMTSLWLLHFFTPRWQKIMIRKNISNYKNCIVSDVENFEDRFSQIISRCLALHTQAARYDNEKFSTTANGSFEAKTFLRFNAQSEGEKCFWLTMGIGGVSHVERDFLIRYPECQVFGIEPSRVGDFAQIGTVIPLGVGVRGELMTVHDYVSGKFYQIHVSPLTQLLDGYLRSRFVHFAALDIDGPEYELVNALRRGYPLDRDSVVFCQIDVEFHAVLWRNGTLGSIFNDYHTFWTNILSESPYVPLFASLFFNPLGNAQKVTLVNTENEKCLRLFDVEKYFL